MPGTLRLHGYRELLKAFQDAPKTERKALRDDLRAAGRIVQADAVMRLAHYNPEAARTLRVAVRQRGVAVEQSHPRVTGKRPDFGALQMNRALIPALDDKRGEVEQMVERTLDRLAARF